MYNILSKFFHCLLLWWLFSMHAVDALDEQILVEHRSQSAVHTN
jgi:hypothetical protein